MARPGEVFGDLVRRFGAGVVALVSVVLVVIVAVVVAVTTGGGKTYHLTAYFSKTVGLYEGNDVRIMGVKVGHIDSITPEGTVVKVVMSYDGDDRVPLHAKAVMIEPSIVSDRFVQLTPPGSACSRPAQRAPRPTPASSATTSTSTGPSSSLVPLTQVSVARVGAPCPPTQAKSVTRHPGLSGQGR